MSRRIIQPMGENLHLWFAAGFALVALASTSRFPGLSGWLGAAGWFAMGALFVYNPALAARRPHFTRYHRAGPVVLGAALLLIVASVVVWSVEP